jgi:putative Mg2+ transporter-C (MgtC) family protein
VLEAVIVGISFLGAGTIARAKSGDVEGLTTAASILLTPAIGMSVAIGEVAFAAMLTGGTVAVLWIVGEVERRLFASDAGGES